MPKEQNDIKVYNAGDFERYYSGEMSEQEMHSLEKAALDDPFLFEAIDGYAHTNAPAADIIELRNRLHQRTDVKKPAGFKNNLTITLLKIAAVLILFAGLGWLLYKKSDIKNQEIAAVKEANTKDVIPGTFENKKTDSIIVNQTEGLVAVVTPNENKKQVIDILQKNNSSNQAEKKDIDIATGATNNTLDQTGLIAMNDSVSNTNANFNSRNIQQESANNINNMNAGKEQNFQFSSLKKIRGKITDSKGNPVSFANVIDKKNNIGVQSDREGSFALSTLDSAPQVDINSTGYKKVTKTLSTDSAKNNLVLLEQDNSFNEVVVTSAFKTKKTKQVIPNSARSVISQQNEKIQRIKITNAIPVNGWGDFNKYVIDSLKTLDQLDQGSVSTEILVSFDINNKGEPVDINVNKSLCSACESEVIRFIKKGPTWKLNKKRKKAFVVVKF